MLQSHNDSELNWRKKTYAISGVNIAFPKEGAEWLTPWIRREEKENQFMP